MREGVNKVALRLFEHNEKAYHAAVRMMDQYGKVAIVHPTGTGKSYIAFKLIEDNPEKVVIWLSPSEYIFKTQLESLKRNDPDFPLANVHFYTYAKLMCCTQAQLEKIAAQKPAYIILDEFHRAGAECWGESTVALLKLCPDAKLLGLTATNVRYLDNNRDMAEELFDGHIASDMNLGEAVVRGILPTPKYVTTVYQYQKALAKYQARVDNLRTPGIRDVNPEISGCVAPRTGAGRRLGQGLCPSYYKQIWKIHRVLRQQRAHGRDGVPCAGVVRRGQSRCCGVRSLLR